MGAETATTFFIAQVIVEIVAMLICIDIAFGLFRRKRESSSR